MTAHRGALGRKIRWRAAASLVAVIATSGLLAYEGARLTRVDLWAMGGVVLVLATLALLFGRDVPDGAASDGGERP